MPRLDYYGVVDAIREKLESDPLLIGVAVRAEDVPDFSNGLAPWIGVYLDRRDPSDGQAIDAGRSTRYRLRLSVWCWAMSVESVQDAIRQRDELVSKAERVLMGDRTFGGVVGTSWLSGGEMPSGRLPVQDMAFASGGEITVIAEATTDLD